MVVLFVAVTRVYDIRVRRRRGYDRNEGGAEALTTVDSLDRSVRETRIRLGQMLHDEVWRPWPRPSLDGRLWTPARSTGDAFGHGPGTITRSSPPTQGRRWTMRREHLSPNVMAVVVAAALVGVVPHSGPAGPTHGEPDSGTDTPVAEASGGWQPPSPPASAESEGARAELVRDHIADPGDIREAVRDERVLEAMRTVPRHEFVPADVRRLAYRDSPLPIGHGQTVSQPYIVALMTAHLELERGEKVLEIGTGSGYQAAVLGQLTPHVYSVEIIEPLAERARRTLDEQGYDHVETRHADGYHGWPEQAPFDAIIVTAAAGHVPPPLWDQLAPGGRMVIPIGGTHQIQRLVLLEKRADGGRSSETLTSVRFVPMTGRVRQ